MEYVTLNNGVKMPMVGLGTIGIAKEAEPVLIETNLTWGGSVQIAAGPVFGELTKDVLDYIMKNKN